ncbi:hypothetical protein Cgig2_003493 [Carnegiea gigantea]|uniref:Wax synthase domain-containing protein n=1 Tax=Carnegiea gigantea TaxID=171969 RepID=A0A9Q1KB81_9CARY|nr:hypothetical protein Cgig2_003493 [Carnegiea gigantea]
MELAEDEMGNFGKVWALVIVSLSYCFIIGKIIPKGFRRLVAVLPIISLFIALPLNLTSIHLCGFTAFLITWLANFKLLLFAFGEPPLCSDPPISFAHFLAVACLPIKIQTAPKSKVGTNPDQEPQKKSYPPRKNLQKSQNNQNPYQKTPSKSCPSPKYPKNPSEKSLWNYIVKAIIVALFLQIYDHSQQIPQMILWIIYFLHMFFVLEIVSASLAKLATFFLGLQLEPQFNKPLLSTSLQDFWGRRWNLMVNSIIRPTVFQPIRDLTLRPLGPLLATYLAVMAAFVVSAIMHELMLFYLGRVMPTFEVTWFFLLHGVCVCLEVTVKVYVGKRWRVPWWISCPATLGWVVATACWLFLPPMLRAGVYTKGVHEYTAAGTSMRSLELGISNHWTQLVLIGTLLPFNRGDDDGKSF